MTLDFEWMNELTYGSENEMNLLENINHIKIKANYNLR